MTFKEFIESIVKEYEEEYGPIEEHESEEEKGAKCRERKRGLFGC